MSEISNSHRSQEAPTGPSGISRRSVLRGIGLFAAGGVAGSVLANELLGADQKQPSPYELTENEVKNLEEARKHAEERARQLEACINATVHTKEPVDILTLDGIYLNDRVGAPIWKIDKPILFGDPPKLSDRDKGFWFGTQFPDPGGIDRPPSVGIRAVLFDPRYMALSSLRVHLGQDLIVATQMQVLVMPPDPHMPPSDVMVAYAYNEFEPDHRQRNSHDRSQLVAPGLQVPVE